MACAFHETQAIVTRHQGEIEVFRADALRSIGQALAKQVSQQPSLLFPASSPTHLPRAALPSSPTGAARSSATLVELSSTS